MSKPTYYLYDVLREIDRYYEDIYEEYFKENEQLCKQIEFLEERHKYLRTRCMESARDSFDKGNYGALIIVKGLSQSELLMNMSDGIGHTETLKKFGIDL